MAIPGRKPRPSALKLINNPGRRPIGEVQPRRDGPLEPPCELTEAQQKLWTRFINPAWWLGEMDVPTAFMWVKMQVEYQEAEGMFATNRLENLRAVMSELGLGERRAQVPPEQPPDEAPQGDGEEFFG